MGSKPLFCSPASPSQLLSYIINHETHPTTLIICSPRADFIQSLINDVHPKAEAQDSEGGEDQNGTPLENRQPSEAARLLLQAPLFQVAIARHIRMVFIPTVSHLRAFLSVFSPSDTKIIAPPLTTYEAREATRAHAQRPQLLIYGFLDLHRDTSEWSAQGLCSTAASFVETASLHAFQPVLVEPRKDELGDLSQVVGEQVPLLSGTTLRMGHDADGMGWSGRTVEIKRVLGRWFRYHERGWDEDELEAARSV